MFLGLALTACLLLLLLLLLLQRLWQLPCLVDPPQQPRVEVVDVADRGLQNLALGKKKKIEFPVSFEKLILNLHFS